MKRLQVLVGVKRKNLPAHGTRRMVQAEVKLPLFDSSLLAARRCHIKASRWVV
jgi:hypothetical protein